MFGPHPQVFRQEVLAATERLERQQERQVNELANIAVRLEHVIALLEHSNDVQDATAELQAALASISQLTNDIGWN